MKANSQISPAVGPVVAAAHLADGAMPSLSEAEFALAVLGNAFQRWMVRCASAAGMPGLAAIDVQVLHAANHRGREKSLADICMMYNIEDTHVVAYAMKKLEAMKLIETGRRGKEKIIRVTQKGSDACRRYREIREALLVATIKELGFDERRVSEVAGLMRALSGQYDQAARSAVSL